MKSYFIVDASDCLRRKIDAHRIKNYLSINGYSLAENAQDADFVIVSTCGVTNDKVQEAVQTINELICNTSTIIVVGCAVTTDSTALPKDTINIPINKMNMLDDIFHSEIPYDTIPIPTKSNDENLCYFTICRGCSEGCSYCATRKAIGNVKSVPLDNCIHLFKKIMEKNPDRVIFDGDNIGAYGIDIGFSIGELLDSLPPIPKKHLLNIDMLHPYYFLENFEPINNCVKNGSIGYLLIPFQSGNKRILKAMHRRGDISQVANRLVEIRKSDPGIILGTHVIIGFPSETYEEYNDTIQLLKETQLDWIRVFCFSSRHNTIADRMPGHISEEEMKKRLANMESEMKKDGYFAKINPSGVTFCRKRLAIEKQYEDNPYRLICYREVIDL